jgi:hypothetical protein
METKIVLVMWRNNKWAVKKSKSKRALRLFEHREIAFHYACQIMYTSWYYNDSNTDCIELISVHSKDGSVDFQYNSLREKIT